jgi:hypothetical protein
MSYPLAESEVELVDHLHASQAKMTARNIMGMWVWHYVAALRNFNFLEKVNPSKFSSP